MIPGQATESVPPEARRDQAIQWRAGIESTNSGLKNRLGLKRLKVRGRGSVFRVILHKVAGWNVLRAAVSKKELRVDQDPGGRDAQGGSWGR